jgi:hypothetical protein
MNVDITVFQTPKAKTEKGAESTELIPPSQVFRQKTNARVLL